MQVSNTKAYLANTNVFIKSQLANTNSSIASRATWSALTSTNTAIRNYVDTSVSNVVNAAPGTLNTLRELASALANDANFAVSTTNLIATKISVANTKAYLANTNAYIATRATWASVTGTNTAIRSLVSDRLQVANAKSYMQVANTKAYLANTNAYIATKVSTTSFNTIWADTNSRITLVNSNLTGTNTALRTLISDRLQVANAAAAYQTKSVERAALANTNSWNATQDSRITLINTNLTGTNTALRTLINDRLQVANAVATYQTKAVERAALANTNSRINLLNTNLLNTNTTIRSLISSSGGSLVTTTTATVKNLTQNDTVITGVTAAVATGYLQVANAVATYTTKAYAAANSYVKSTLANTNAYIATRATWAALTATNTAIRALDTAKLSVANAVSTYATKASPTTSGLLAHTGRATVSTNLAVSGNTTLSGLVSINYTGSANSSLAIRGTNTKGGAGYHDFLVAYNGGGGSAPAKWFRTDSSGNLQLLNSAYTAVIMQVSDAGQQSIAGAASTSNDPTTNWLSFNNNNFALYDDGNPHIHSRGSGTAMWINTNGGDIRMQQQSPVNGGSVGNSILMGGSSSATATGYLNVLGSKSYAVSGYGYLAASSGGPSGYISGSSGTVPYGIYCSNRIQATEFDATSDERAKVIQGTIPLETAINFVKKIDGIHYTWDTDAVEHDDKGLKAGFGAQAVHKAGFDHMVGVIRNDQMKEQIDEDGWVHPEGMQLTMGYNQAIAYHHEVIKHLLNKIDDLEKKLKEVTG
jgi:chorismate mutase